MHFFQAGACGPLLSRAIIVDVNTPEKRGNKYYSETIFVLDWTLSSSQIFSVVNI